MRRNEKEITDKSAIEAIIRQSLVGRLGLSEGGQPYVVPLCFGYEDGALYFHAALEGRKMEMMRNNDRVCFEFDANAEIVQGKQACDWGIRYQSVIGFGNAAFLHDMEEKRKALGIIMRQYSGLSFHFPDNSMARTAVIKITIERMTAKQSGY
jgi:uncharacterized protein